MLVNSAQLRIVSMESELCKDRSDSDILGSERIELKVQIGFFILCGGVKYEGIYI